MAAKQGTLAQLSAQAEDAKRAVLSKAGSSWFSTHTNNNTVCTIKSAPPRSPEVLSMLATKSGWLYKRNEQHVWQARWCCVVPHTFLYYFDAPVVGNSASHLPPLPNQSQQDAWNRAVLQGLGRHRKKPHEKRSHFPLFNAAASTSTTTTTANTASATTTASTANSLVATSATQPAFLSSDPDPEDGTPATATTAPNVPPAGIIDLECYTTSHQSQASVGDSSTIFMQLAGDDQVNPDLRPFYFSCDNAADVDEWNAALLQHRHGALHDEVEAYKQVADSFAQQLQVLHTDLDRAVQLQEESDQVLYRVRSVAEETRRTVYRIADECWEKSAPGSTSTTAAATQSSSSSSSSSLDGGGTSGESPSATTTGVAALMLVEKRTEFRRHMETVRLQDLGVAAAVRLLAEYIVVAEDCANALQYTVSQLQTDVQKSGQTDQAEILERQAAAETAAKVHAAEKEQLLQELAQAHAATQAVNKELKDVQKDLSSTKMEVTMLMSQQRNKLATQQQHKKILKKEVIDLRQKVEDVASEHSSLKHEHDKLVLHLEQERNKSQLLSKYINKMESQVQVQQSMMEMMSQAGGCSLYGGMSVAHQLSGDGGGGVIGGRSIASNADYPSNRGNNNNKDRKNVPTSTNNTHKQIETEDDQGDMFDDENVKGDFENDEKLLLQPPNIPLSPPKQIRPQQFGRRLSNPTPPHPQHSSVARRGNSYLSDNDADNKSHVSELTEDRTQREFTLFQHGNLFASNSGYEPDVPASSPTLRHQDARYRKRLQEQRLVNSSRFVTGPPSVIIGVKTTDIHDESKEASHFTPHALPLQNDNRGSGMMHHSSSSVQSLPAELTHSRICGGSANFRSEGNRKPSHNESHSIGRASLDAATLPNVRSHPHSTDRSVDGDTAITKRSVAQQARLDADQKSTPVRARLDDASLSAFQRSRSGTSLVGIANLRESSVEADKNKSVLSPQHSQGSGLWRRVEEAVLGPRSEDDEDDDDDDDASFTCSEGSTRVTDLTEGDKEKSVLASNAKSAKQRFSGRDLRDMEEKKSCDSVSISNLSLQERCRIQRDKQLRFLREQGLIHYAMDGKGGAGSVLDTASVTSSSFSANGNGGRLNIGSSVVSHRNHLPKSTSASANPTS